jgi:anthranilate 1,2-dioxygenase ferredoxin subunit
MSHAQFRRMEKPLPSSALAKCTHERVPLSEGFVENGCVECPLHQGLFDIRTGQARKAPCVTPVRTYPLRIVDGRVEINVSEF